MNKIDLNVFIHQATWHRQQVSTTSLAQPSSSKTRLLPRDARAHLLRLIEDVGKVALSAVLTVMHGSHEDTSTALTIIISTVPPPVST